MTTKVDIDRKAQFIEMFQDLLSLLAKLHGISEELLAAANCEMNHSCWVVFTIIHDAETAMSVPQIATHRSITRQAVQRQICLLLEKNFIKAVENPHNKRSPFYVVTEQGIAFYNETCEKVYDPWLSKLAAHYNYDDTKKLVGALKELDGALNRIDFKSLTATSSTLTE